MIQISKTIKQIADELGVSKTAIRKKMTEDIKTKFSETIGNTIYISEQGEDLIKSGFKQINENKVFETKTETISTLVSVLQKELQIKNEQLATKDKQISELQKLLDQQQQLQFNQQKSIPVMPEKLSLWKRIFNNKK